MVRQIVRQTIYQGIKQGINFSYFTPHFPLTPSEVAAAVGAGASWREILTFQESSGDVVTLDTARTATATGTAPPTYTIAYEQSGPTATHSSIKLGGSVSTVTTSRFVFGNAAIEPGSSSFAAIASLYLHGTPGGTQTVFGIETGAHYWRVRMTTAGHLTFQIFDGSLSNTVTLAYDHRDTWTTLLLSMNQSTDTLTLTSQLGTVSSSSVPLGAINSASRGLAIGSTAAPHTSWAYFAYTQTITGLESSPSTLISNFETYTGQ